MELRTYVEILWRRRWVIAFVTALATIVAVVAALRTTPMYTATATVRVWKSSAGYEDISYTERLMRTYAAIVTSPPVKSQLREEVGVSGSDGSLDSRISVNFPTNTELMEISFEDVNATTAANGANKLAEILIEQSRGTRAERDYTVALIGPAGVPGSPDTLGRNLLVVLGVIVGLGGGVAVAFLLENMDTALHSTETIEAVTGLATLGMIPHVSRRKVTFLNGNSPEGEAFRQLRTRLLALSRDTRLQTLLVTSAEPNEGKSTVVSNLALTMAQYGRNVVLIDADMRLPTVHKIFDMPNTYGLSSVLNQEMELDDALQMSRIPGIQVLTSGPTPSHPAELLGTPQMSTLIEELSRRYDMVLVDAPAFLAVTDAAILASMVDGVLLVVGRSTAREETVQAARQQLLGVKARPIGVVVNRAEQPHSYEYYHKK
jgi:capsular exopolysaccharide synthesis family protein